MVDLDSERQELDAMVERLARSPRLANLLKYIGDRYLSGEATMLREFEIATEVFGRTTDFDPGEDAIARVEAHRLRKKLKLYYETEGRGNLVRITIPSGSYLPVFTHQPAGGERSKTAAYEAQIYATNGRSNASETPSPLKLDADSSLTLRPNHWRWIVVAAALVLGCGLLYQWRARSPVAKATEPGPKLPASIMAEVQPPLTGTPPANEYRLIAGYQGQPQMDTAGNKWEGDRFFLRGGAWRNAQGFTARTNDEFLYRMVRTGEFEYNLPLNPGVYELHLFFDETGFGPNLGGGEGSRSMNILSNHQVLLSDFDILSDAMGPNIADEKVFRDMHPGSDGKLNVEFTGLSGKPIVSALAVFPGLPHKQLPIRLTAQPTKFIDQAGNMWNPDEYSLGGQSSSHKPPVSGTPDPGLFAMERYGHFSYALPVDLRGTYTVTLYFAEFYFGANGHAGGLGNRRFNVYCNGNTLLHNFDIFSEAGPLHAITKTFRHLKPSPQGKLDLVFEPIANYANISAIEVVDESQ